MLGEAFQYIWLIGRQFLSFRLDFGDISFSLWDFCLGVAILSIVLYLINRLFE